MTLDRLTCPENSPRPWKSTPVSGDPLASLGVYPNVGDSPRVSGELSPSMKGYPRAWRSPRMSGDLPWCIGLVLGDVPACLETSSHARISVGVPGGRPPCLEICCLSWRLGCMSDTYSVNWRFALLPANLTACLKICSLARGPGRLSGDLFYLES
ncbi:hypothetical protein NDU88_007709 [Pleurodeles waltl]|uniref:Uncharacterized protein n=1 Tax=Pleurodeles waltl TaxID=8319 RepID=A0AAV7N743_PLEWA|nr:hypothetical protein NDU88_007709 [Pleurodeles waltl]